MKVFISYCHDDDPEHPQPGRSRVRDYVDRLKTDLGEERVFWDRDIQPGTVWLDELARRVSEADTLLVFASLAASRSRHVRREVLQADNRNANIVSIALAPLQPQDRTAAGLDLILDDRQSLKDYELGFEETYTRLLSMLRKRRPSQTCPVIAVMGVKGGVGKSTVVKAIAELMASAGATVMVIDADLESAGFTHDVSRQARTRPHVWTMLDAAYAKQRQEQREADAPNQGLWDVTPPYLRGDARFGSMYLIPGRAQTDLRQSWDALADIPAKRRSTTALDLIQEAVARKRILNSGPACVLIDCGAENNPLVSAGFAVARYGFIVCGPGIEFVGDIPRLNRMHRERFPTFDLADMNVVVNRAEEQTYGVWRRANVSFIPEDPEMRAASASGAFDFEGIGLNNFYLEVLNVLKAHLDPADRHLLPDEIDAWIRPRIALLVREHIPERLLARWPFRVGALFSLVAVIIGLILAGAGTYLNYRGAQSLRHGELLSLAILEFDDRQLAESALRRSRDGTPLTDLATSWDGANDGPVLRVRHATVAPGDAVPGVGHLSGLGTWLRGAQPATVGEHVYTSDDGGFYVVQVVERRVPDPFHGLKQSGSAVLIVVGLVGSALGCCGFVRIRRRRRLLVEVAERRTERPFLERLLRDNPEKRELRWLKEVVNRELWTER